jgi:Sigma-70 region 2
VSARRLGGTYPVEEAAMNPAALGTAVRRLAEGRPRTPADAELLRRFVAGRDEAAFAAIVARHGPMVLGACRRVLGDRHAAEDACQQTFAALARSAAAVRDGAALAAWLHRASRRFACR